VAARPRLISSRLGAVEAERAVRRVSPLPGAELREVLDTVDLIELSPPLMARAGALTPAELRTLDAIHLATLLLLGPADLDVVTYDDRLATAARQHGFTVLQPGHSEGSGAEGDDSSPATSKSS
jgi:predicted nucleic acid-binding protein